VRVCARIGCENSLEGKRSDARYCRPTCKARGFDQRRKLVVDSRPERRSGPSGLQLAYRKAVEAAYRTATIAVMQAGDPFASPVREIAEREVRSGLSVAQRARLEARS